MLLQKNRLTKDREIKRVFAKSRKISDRNFLIYVHKRNEETVGPVRLAFVLSTKLSKKATLRNRAKRILSEFIRKVLKEENMLLSGKDVVITVKDIRFLDMKKTERSEFLEKDFRRLIKQANDL